ncbi:COG4678 Muramidase (phage lambda lysozyme) [Methylophilaceae bacterium]
MNVKALLAGGLIGYSAYLLAQKNQGEIIDLADGDGSVNGFLTNAATRTTDFIESLSMGLFSIGNMNRAKPEMLSIPNVRAMLAVIRKGEGTSDNNGYKRIFGGQLFSSFLDHPRVTVNKNGYKSSAAGAYQFLISTWDETKRVMGLKDFTPAAQDLAALGRIAARGALDDVIAGRFLVAIKKLGKEWASLPYSPYGQPTQTIQGAQSIYLANNGTIATG